MLRVIILYPRFSHGVFMFFDPYRRDTPGLPDPANNLFLITPDDGPEITIGIKAMRIWNPNEFAATIHVITVMGDQVAFSVPALTLWTEPLRITKLLTATTSGVVVHGYTDRSVVVPSGR